MFARALFGVVAIVMLCACRSIAQSTAPWPVAEYAAPDAPTNQNWIVHEYDPMTSIWAHAVFDAAHSTNVWMTHVEAGQNGGGIRYQVTLPPRMCALAQTHGWRLQTRMRAPGTPQGSIIGVELAETSYYLSFYTADSVHAYLLAATNLSQLSPGPPFVGHWVNTSAAYSEYHTFDMTYDPGNDAVSISVDDSVVLTNYHGMSFSAIGEQSVAWGAGGTYTSDETYWMDVSFSLLLPRPAISAVHATHSDTVDLEWFAWSNLLYRADRSDSLVEPSWEPTGSTITGADSIVTIPFEIGLTNRQFLRLQTWPQE